MNSQIIRLGNDHVYYNIMITQDKSTNQPTPAIFYEETVEPIIMNPSEYYVSIIRFSVPGAEIPIYVIPIQDNQPDPNLTKLSVTLTYLGNDFQTFLIYVPDNALPVPPPPIPQQKLSEYYHVYSYQKLVNMINTALATSFTALKTAFPLAPINEAPYYIFNSLSELFSLIVPYNYIGNCEIWVNYYLLNYMEAIPVYYSAISAPNGKDFRFLIEDRKNNSYSPPGGTIPAPPALPNYLEFRQEYRVEQYWASFKNLVFVSNSMPIKYEYVPISLSGTRNFSIGEANSRPIMTDFEPLLDAPGAGRSQLQYFPQGPYRLIDLKSTQPLRKFDIQIFWQDTQNNLYPIKLFGNQIATIKILFVKKNVSTFDI